MIRARFKANLEDSRPVNWPIKYPYWESGFNDEHSIVVAYAENEDEILKNWPEAKCLESEEVEKVEFTSRFTKPDWYQE